jgi:3-hydroxyisobutyrate dehydrogenase
MSSIAFLGLGVMGGAMASRLVDANESISVWNRHRDRADALAAKGARVAKTPREAAGGADVVFAMVADDAASRSIWLGDDGALAGAKKGAVLIESSTLSPAWIRELSKAATARGCFLLDAPVTGSKPQAAAGQLLFLVGGNKAAFELVRPVFAKMGRDAIYLGATGSGATLKLINNVTCGVQLVAIAEALAMIEKSGLDRDLALKVLTEGAPGSPLVKTVLPRMTSQDYTVNFALALLRKDVCYAIDAAQALGVTLETAAAARTSLDHAIAAGHGDRDMAAVVEALGR